MARRRGSRWPHSFHRRSAAVQADRRQGASAQIGGRRHALRGPHAADGLLDQSRQRQLGPGRQLERRARPRRWPGLFHLAQGAPYVYGYSAGQATDFAYLYSANPGSSYVVSGTAESYMSATDTVAGVTQSYFNVGVGFLQNTGVSRNLRKDFAYP